VHDGDPSRAGGSGYTSGSPLRAVAAAAPRPAEPHRTRTRWITIMYG
jgi:hypothetical protein